MNNRPFCLLGNIIKTYEYSLTYKDSDGKHKVVFDIDMPNIEIKQAKLEHQGATSFVVNTLDTTSHEWLDGIDIGECNMEMAEKIWQMG